MKKIFENIPWWIKFLSFMILVYIMSFLLFPSYTYSSFLGFIKSFIDILPMLILMFFVIFIINIFLKPESVKKHLWHDSWIKWWIYTCIGSILISWPPYILFPMLKELRQHWMKYSLIALFMNNRNVQPAFLPAMIYYFWFDITIVVSIYIMIFAILNAFLIWKILDNN